MQVPLPLGRFSVVDPPWLPVAQRLRASRECLEAVLCERFPTTPVVTTASMAERHAGGGPAGARGGADAPVGGAHHRRDGRPGPRRAARPRPAGARDRDHGRQRDGGRR